MARDLSSEPLPPRDAVLRFFSVRGPCTISEVAELLGTVAAEIRRRIDAGELECAAGLIPWEAAAHAFRDAWPPHVAERLLRRVVVYPRLLRLKQVQLRLPAYLLLALERQVLLEQTRRGNGRYTAEQFVAEEIEAAIDPEVIETLKDDAAFREAYEFPDTAQAERTP